MTIQKITVGVDGNPSSRAALDWVVDRARRSPTDLELISVVRLPDPGLRTMSTVLRFYSDNLREAADFARDTGVFAAVSTRLEYGLPTEMLLEASSSTDLLVVGTDRTTQARHLVYGTVPLQLAALSDSPLVVVPRSWTPDHGVILLGVGDDTCAESAIAFAEHEAMLRTGTVELVHVWEAASAYPSPLAVVGFPWQAVEESARLVIERAATEIREGHPDLTVTTSLLEGPIIPRLAERAQDARILIVGRADRGILHDVMKLGSVVHGVLLNPPAPVAVIPAQRVVRSHAAEWSDASAALV